METSYTSSQNYINEFQSQDYYKTYYVPEKGALMEWMDFALRNLHEIFTSGGIKGDLLIDLGSGPTIYQVLSACEVFKNIILSDFVEQNCIELQKWLRKDPDALDWSHAVKLVCELEGNSSSENLENKQEKLRRTVTEVLKCDALKRKPYDPVEMPQADCLISSLVLEAISKDVEHFTNILRNLKDLIKPGGHIILQSVLNSPFYHVGEKLFSALAITKEELEKAFKEAGYEIVSVKVSLRNDDKQHAQITEFDSYYCIHGRKPCN